MPPGKQAQDPGIELRGHDTEEPEKEFLKQYPYADRIDCKSHICLLRRIPACLLFDCYTFSKGSASFGSSDSLTALYFALLQPGRG